jgi:hypothetical protein
VDGTGAGPLALELKTTPPDLTTLSKKNGGVFPLSRVYETIDGRQEIRSHGTREMPIWGYRYMPSPNIAATQGFNPKFFEGAVDLSYDPEAIVRGRILAVVDYLYRVQQK